VSGNRMSEVERRGADIFDQPRKGKRAVRVQYSALPYRFTVDAALEILLVTTRQTKRWIVPKGWPIKGLKPAKSAAREAFEEAGVRGRVGARAIGHFTYDKILDGSGSRVVCEVRVFPLLVKRQSRTWPEIEQRVVQWFAPDKALTLIKEPELQALIGGFAHSWSPSTLPSGVSAIGKTR
jgi:8-oxo-dGTP pyrophosphatase MutT (NUDIX family)